MNMKPVNTTNLLRRPGLICFLCTVALTSVSLSGLCQVATQPQTIVDQNLKVRTYKDSPLPQAVVLWASGKATFSEDGKDFKKLKVGDVLTQGAIVRTDSGSHLDLYFRRMGIMGRVSPGSEL